MVIKDPHCTSILSDTPWEIAINPWSDILSLWVLVNEQRRVARIGFVLLLYFKYKSLIFAGMHAVHEIDPMLKGIFLAETTIENRI
jgi:hypothetical protein